MKFKNSYKELSINEYLQLYSILTTQSEYLNKELEILKILVDDVKEFEATPFREISNITAGEFLQEEVGAERVRKTYIIKDREFSCITKPSKLSTAQFIDLTAITKQMGNALEVLDKVCSVFLVPKGHTYGEGYDVSELADWLGENCPITIANDISFFLFGLKQKLLQNSLLYLEAEIKAMKWTAKTKEQKEKVTLMEKEMATIKGGCGSFLSTKYVK